jgi:hypothetical protein
MPQIRGSEDHPGGRPQRWLTSPDSQFRAAIAIFGGMKSPKRKPTAARLKRWRISLMRSRGHHLGTVEAPDRKAAEAEAVRAFDLSEDQRRRLAVLKQD